MNQGYGYQVVNASVSGETTAGGLARLPRALGLHHPAIVILELGGNDGLRALPVAQMRANLARMAELSAGGGGEGAAAGYADAAQLRSGIHRAVRPGVFRGWRTIRKLAIVPFLLDGIALSPDLHAGGRHPPQPIRPAEIARERLAGSCEPMLERWEPQ